MVNKEKGSKCWMVFFIFIFLLFIEKVFGRNKNLENISFEKSWCIFLFLDFIKLWLLCLLDLVEFNS